MCPYCAGQKIITKVRKGEIATFGPTHNCRSEADFQTKLKNFVYVSKDIQKLDAELKISIAKAMDGEDPGLIIQTDDPKLNLECYQQIVSKLYAVIRHKVYQKIKNKQKRSKKGQKKISSPSDSDLTGSGLKINEITA